MSSLEQRQTVLEDEIRFVPSSSSIICSSAGSNKRRRVTPAVLQVCILLIMYQCHSLLKTSST